MMPVVSPNGKKVYVSTGRAGSVCVLDAETQAVLNTIKVGARPWGIAISPAADLTLASESLKTVHDPIISAKTMPVFRDHYLGKADPRDEVRQEAHVAAPDRVIG